MVIFNFPFLFFSFFFSFPFSFLISNSLSPSPSCVHGGMTSLQRRETVNIQQEQGGQKGKDKGKEKVLRALVRGDVYVTLVKRFDWVRMFRRGKRQGTLKPSPKKTGGEERGADISYPSFIPMRPSYSLISYGSSCKSAPSLPQFIRNARLPFPNPVPSRSSQPENRRKPKPKTKVSRMSCHVVVNGREVVPFVRAC